MTCQHCQTWILDDEHRCGRCGRRVRSVSGRISPATYPIAATATATAYDLANVPEQSARVPAIPDAHEQQMLFTAPSAEARVIPFDSLTSLAERDAIRQRAESSRPEPLRNAKVESKRARTRRTSSGNQRHLEFQGHDEIVSQPRTHLICDAPVAPAGIRFQAACLDGLLMACGCGIIVGIFLYTGGVMAFENQALAFFAGGLLTVPLVYKLLWAFAGQDTPGMRIVGLELVDFDGRRPTKGRRYGRALGSVLSLTAAGIGMIWALVDEDKLAWHDHISASFPTFADDE